MIQPRRHTGWGWPTRRPCPAPNGGARPRTPANGVAKSAPARVAGAAADDEPGLDHGYRRREGRLVDPASGGSAPPDAAGSPAPRRPSVPAPRSRRSPRAVRAGDRNQLTGNAEPGGDVGHRGLAHTISCRLPRGYRAADPADSTPAVRRGGHELPGPGRTRPGYSPQREGWRYRCRSATLYEWGIKDRGRRPTGFWWLS